MKLRYSLHNIKDYFYIMSLKDKKLHLTLRDDKAKNLTDKQFDSVRDTLSYKSDIHRVEGFVGGNWVLIDEYNKLGTRLK